MFKKPIAPVIAVLFLLVGSNQLLHAQRDWQYLGEANVDGQADHDKIKVGESQGTFRAIRLKVDVAPVQFDRVRRSRRCGFSDCIDLYKSPVNSSTRKPVSRIKVQAFP